MTPVIECLAMRYAAALVEYYRLDRLNSESPLDYYKLDKIAAGKTLDIEEAELHAACEDASRPQADQFRRMVANPFRKEAKP